jgi:disulfide bond formation protein DsbB
VDPAPRPAPQPRRTSPRRRYQRYFLIMGTCVLLIVLAWTWVRFYSVTAAVIMSIVASVLPPLAAVVTNADSPILRGDADSAPPDEHAEQGPPPEWFDQDRPGGGSSRD